MAEYLAIRDGGKTSEEGFTRLISKLSGAQNKGKVGLSDFATTQNGTPNMTVNVAVGDIIIPQTGGNYFYHGWTDAIKNVAVGTSDPSNPRIDRLVAYIDLAVVSSASSNNPGALKFKSVKGTPAGSPTRPSDGTVNASYTDATTGGIGAGNPFVDIADITVDAAVTSILNAKIADKRALFQLGSGIGGIMLVGNGSLTVANDIASPVITPKNGSFTSMYSRVKTAPTGAALIGRVNKNGTLIATFTIAASALNETQTGLNIPFSAGDYFALDITQIGSTVPGSNLTVVLG